MESEILKLSNREGILYSIPKQFIAKETRIGDQHISYQLIRLQRSGLFTIAELYNIASLIQKTQPVSLINWAATFMLLEKDTLKHVEKKLLVVHLA